MKKGPITARSASSPEITNGWAHRALFFAVLFVLIATLFPFQFLPQQTAYRRARFFLRWLSTQPSSLRDLLENILLFIPFGFGLAGQSRKGGWRGFGVVLASGAGFSFLVEFLQVFLPTRAAQWWDVVGNSAGSALGFVIFQGQGEWLLRHASSFEAKIEKFLTGRRIVAAFVAYGGLMLFCSARLQRLTNLTHWAQDDILFVGNDPTQRHPWKGRILRVEIANEVVSPDYFRGGGDAEEQDNKSKTLVAPHVFLDLSAEKREAGTNNTDVEGSAGSALEKAGPPIGIDSFPAHFPATGLINSLKRTNRFTLRVLCIPSEAGKKSSGTIVSLSRDPHHVDFYMNEDRERWVVAIRTAPGGNSRYWDLAFSKVPITGKPQDFTVTYDGSDLAASVNGKPAARPLCLNPGASLIECFKGVSAYNIYGYWLLYVGLAFVPLGFLLALATREPVYRKHRRQMLLATGFLLPPLFLEGVLSLVSGRPFHIENVILGSCLILGAFLLLNSDRSDSVRRHLQAQPLRGPDSLPFPSPSAVTSSHAFPSDRS